MHGGRILLLALAQLPWAGALVSLLAYDDVTPAGRSVSLVAIAVAALFGLAGAVGLVRTRSKVKRPALAIMGWVLGALATVRFVWRVLDDTDLGRSVMESLVPRGGLDAALALILLTVGFLFSATAMGRR